MLGWLGKDLLLKHTLPVCACRTSLVLGLVDAGKLACSQFFKFAHMLFLGFQSQQKVSVSKGAKDKCSERLHTQPVYLATSDATRLGHFLAFCQKPAPRGRTMPRLLSRRCRRPLLKQCDFSASRSRLHVFRASTTGPIRLINGPTLGSPHFQQRARSLQVWEAPPVLSLRHQAPHCMLTLQDGHCSCADST